MLVLEFVIPVLTHTLQHSSWYLVQIDTFLLSSSEGACGRSQGFNSVLADRQTCASLYTACCSTCCQKQAGKMQSARLQANTQQHDWRAVYTIACVVARTCAIAFDRLSAL